MKLEQQVRPSRHTVPLEIKVIHNMETTVMSHIPPDAMLCFVAMVNTYPFFFRRVL